jgi:hypothetical protein
VCKFLPVNPHAPKVLLGQLQHCVEPLPECKAPEKVLLCDRRTRPYRTERPTLLNSYLRPQQHVAKKDRGRVLNYLIEHFPVWHILSCLKEYYPVRYKTFLFHRILSRFVENCNVSQNTTLSGRILSIGKILSCLEKYFFFVK